jgi:hypothetical protein
MAKTAWVTIFIEANMKRIITILTALAATLVISNCDALLGPDVPVGAGNLVIGFGESGDSGRAAAPPGLERYGLVLSGPGDQKIEASVSAGEAIAQRWPWGHGI